MDNSSMLEKYNSGNLALHYLQMLPIPYLYLFVILLQEIKGNCQVLH